MESWTFLTNHGHVILSIATDPEIRLRDVAQKVGITERAAQRIVADLIEGGYLTSVRIGRRNRYTLNLDRGLRHPVEQHCRITSLLSLVAGASSNGQQKHGSRRAAAPKPAVKRARSV